MLLRVYSVYDKTAGVYMSPFFCRSDVEAVRNIKASFADPNVANTPIGQAPGDFELRLLGSFNDETGVIEAGSDVIGNIGAIVRERNSSDSSGGTVPS